MKRKIAVLLLFVISSFQLVSSQVVFKRKFNWAISSLTAEPSQTIRLSNGVQLEYVEQGDPNGIPLILLHGYSDSWHSYATVLPHLPAGLHVFAVSQRGHGDSDRPAAGYTPADLANDIADFIKLKKLGPVIIAGHSMGGFVVQRFVLDYPQLAKGMVIISSAAKPNHDEATKQFGDMINSLQDPVDPQFIDAFQKSTIKKPVSPAYYDTIVSESKKLPAYVWKSIWKGLMEFDVIAELKEIQVPVLLLLGDNDGIFTIPQQKILRSNIKNSKLLIYKGVGHALHWEEPIRFSRDIADFINGIQ